MRHHLAYRWIPIFRKCEEITRPSPFVYLNPNFASLLRSSVVLDGNVLSQDCFDCWVVVRGGGVGGEETILASWFLMKED